MTDRNTIIRECAQWILAHSPSFRPLLDGRNAARVTALRSVSRDMQAALLSVPASEPSHSADVLTAPVDHGPAADGEGEAGIVANNWTPDERTVRACIEVLPDTFIQDGQDYNSNPVNVGKDMAAVRALESLLPKPDPIAALVERFVGSIHDNPHIDTDVRMNRLVRWLVSEGRLTL